MTTLNDVELQDLYYTYHPSEWAKDNIEPALNIKLDRWQSSFLDDEAKRQLLLIHRQGGKSTAVAIKAIHRAVFRRNQTVVLISPSQRQSSDLLRTIRRMMSELPGTTALAVDNVLTMELANGSRIVSYPGSSWTIRGATANLVIIDEAAGVPDEIFAAVSPMLLTTNGQFVVISTPKNKSGAFYAFYKSEDWKKYIVRASENERMKLHERAEFLATELKTIGSRIYSREYECEFLDDADVGLIKRGWWMLYDIDTVHQLRQRSQEIYISWDTAQKDKEHDDYSVGTVWLKSGDNHYMLDAYIDKPLFPELVDAAIELNNRWRPVYNLVEDKVSGTALIQLLKTKRPNMPIKAIDPGQMSKLQRLNMAAPSIESGHVYLPATRVGDALIPTSTAEAVMRNMSEFPLGEHDDITDSVSQYLNYARTTKPQKIEFL
jgi:predicted phage terminase large subunit-like protein